MIPYPGMSFTAFDYLSANELNKIVQNIQSLSNGTGFEANAISNSALDPIAVNADVVDWSEDGGIWWEELGRTTLGSNGDTLTIPLSSARKNMEVRFFLLPTGGTINMDVRVNGISSAAYARRRSANGAADSVSTSATQIATINTAGSDPIFGLLKIKYGLGYETYIESWTSQATTGAGNAPNRNQGLGKWAITNSPITEINLINGGGTGDYAIGSSAVVIGHD